MKSKTLLFKIIILFTVHATNIMAQTANSSMPAAGISPNSTSLAPNTSTSAPPPNDPIEKALLISRCNEALTPIVEAEIVELLCESTSNSRSIFSKKPEEFIECVRTIEGVDIEYHKEGFCKTQSRMDMVRAYPEALKTCRSIFQSQDLDHATICRSKDMLAASKYIPTKVASCSSQDAYMGNSELESCIGEEVLDILGDNGQKGSECLQFLDEQNQRNKTYLCDSEKNIKFILGNKELIAECSRGRNFEGCAYIRTSIDEECLNELAPHNFEYCKNPAFLQLLKKDKSFATQCARSYPLYYLPLDESDFCSESALASSSTLRSDEYLSCLNTFVQPREFIKLHIAQERIYTYYRSIERTGQLVEDRTKQFEEDSSLIRSSISSSNEYCQSPENLTTFDNNRERIEACIQKVKEYDSDFIISCTNLHFLNSLDANEEKVLDCAKEKKDIHRPLSKICLSNADRLRKVISVDPESIYSRRERKERRKQERIEERALRLEQRELRKALKEAEAK